jgi:hypothetical protein
MNERIQALRGRLPKDLLGIISMYDCHPTADLLKAVEITRWGREHPIPAGMDITTEAPDCMIIHPRLGEDVREKLLFQRLEIPELSN